MGEPGKKKDLFSSSRGRRPRGRVLWKFAVFDEHGVRTGTRASQVTCGVERSGSDGYQKPKDREEVDDLP